MRNPPVRAYPDWNRASRRPASPTRSAPNCQRIQRSARIASRRRERLNLNASTAFWPKRPPCLRRLKTLPKQLDQRRGSILRPRKRLQSAPLPNRPVEQIGRKVALLPTQPQNHQMLQPSRPRRASPPRQPKRRPETLPKQLDQRSKQLDQRRRSILRPRKRLQSAPLPNRLVEQIGRKVALLPRQPQNHQML